MKRFINEYIKYIFIGVFITLFDFVVLIVLTEFFGVYYLISAGIAFVLASVIHYFLSIKYVFSSSRFKSKRVSFLIFLVLGVIGLVLFEYLMQYLTRDVGFHYIISKVIATGIIFTFNFLTRKLILFR